MMNLQYKKISVELYDDYYKLRCDPQNIAWTGFDKAPDYESLKGYSLNQIELKSKEIYLVYNIDKCVGYLYIYFLENSVAEIGYGVHQEYCGKGIASQMHLFSIERARELGCQIVIAYISSKNIGSYKSVMKHEFVKTNEFEYRNLPLQGGMHQFDKYVKIL